MRVAQGLAAFGLAALTALGLAGGARADCALGPLVTQARAALVQIHAPALIDISRVGGALRVGLVVPDDSGVQTRPAPQDGAAEVEALGPGGAALVGWQPVTGLAGLIWAADVALPRDATLHLVVGRAQAVLLHDGQGGHCTGIDLLGERASGTRYRLGQGAAAQFATRAEVLGLVLSDQGARMAAAPPSPLVLDIAAPRRVQGLRAWLAAASPLQPTIRFVARSGRIATGTVAVPRNLADDPDSQVTADELYYMADLQEARPWALHAGAPVMRLGALAPGRSGVALRIGLQPEISLEAGLGKGPDGITAGPALVEVLRPFHLGGREGLFTASLGLLAPDRLGMAGVLVLGDWAAGRGVTLSATLEREADTGLGLEAQLARHGTGVFGAVRGGLGLLVLDRADRHGLGASGYLSYRLPGGIDLSLTGEHAGGEGKVGASLRLPVRPQGGAEAAEDAAPDLRPATMAIGLGAERDTARRARALWAEVNDSMRPAITEAWPQLFAR